MRWKWQSVGMVLVALAFQGAAALAAEEGKAQAASGTVVAVTEGSRTIVMESKLGGKAWIVGAEVTDKTKFSGKAKGLKDVKPGDKITMQFVRAEHGDVARAIAVR